MGYYYNKVKCRKIEQMMPILNDLVADVVITHDGTGVIFSSIKKGLLLGIRGVARW